MQKSKTEIHQMHKCISPFWPDEVISRIYEKQMTWWTICNKKVRNNALSLLPTFVCLFAAFSNLISKIQLSLILIYSQEVIKIKKCQMKKNKIPSRCIDKSSFTAILVKSWIHLCYEINILCFVGTCVPLILFPRKIRQLFSFIYSPPWHLQFTPGDIKLHSKNPFAVKSNLK